jgi:hypothetical protein
MAHVVSTAVPTAHRFTQPAGFVGTARRALTLDTRTHAHRALPPRQMLYITAPGPGGHQQTVRYEIHAQNLQLSNPQMCSR